MNITYKYCLKLTKSQQQRVDSWIGTCRLVYNMALDLKNQAYQKNIPLSFYDLQKQLPGLRRDIDWIKDVPNDALVASIQKLEESYNAFFRRKYGFPKFLSKRVSNSVYLKNDKRVNTIKQIGVKEFKLQKLGKVKVFQDRPIAGVVTNAVITRDLNKYYLSVSCKIEARPLPASENQVGIDVGISNFAVTSDGLFVEHPRFIFKYQDELRRAHRKLNRCKPLSKNWYQQKLVFQKLHGKVKRSRLDFLHKISTHIVQTNGFISVEDLNLKGLVRSNLSKHIADSAWHTFKVLLKYKSELYGRKFVEVSPNYSSQECFSCGHTAKGNRQSQSIFVCVECGHADNADLNASKNLLRRGQRLLAQSTETTLRLAKEVA